MVLSLFFIALLSYGLGLLDVCGLVSRYAFQDDPGGVELDYYAMYRRHQWRGVAYTLAADVLRALVTVLIGGMLLKGAGFPSVGKLTALLFALVGQAVPVTRFPDSKQELVFPALTLLFVDWRLFLVCVALGVLVMALTGRQPLMALAFALAMPVFSIIFGEWWLKVILALGCTAALIWCYREDLEKVLQRQPKKRRGSSREPEDDGE